MNRLTGFLFLITMFFTADIPAQEISVHSINWKIVDKLPATPGQKKALGFAGSVIGINNDVLIVGGGSNFLDSMPWQGGKKKYYNDLYVYVLKGDKISLLKKTNKLPFALAYAANCSTPHGIFYAGGENENGISNKVVLVQWDKKKSNVIFKNLPDLPTPTTNAAAVFINNILYIAGGETSSGATDGFYYLNLKKISEGWKQLPSIPHPVSHTVLAASAKNNEFSVYLLGGRQKNQTAISKFYNSVFEFNILKNHWQEKTSLAYGLSAGTGITDDKGNILLFGGDNGETFHKVEEKIIAINTEMDEVKKQELVHQKNQLQANHPGFSKEILQYNIETDKWKVIGEISYETPVTTTAVKLKNKVFIPSGEIKAGVRTPLILIGKLKYNK